MATIVSDDPRIKRLDRMLAGFYETYCGDTSLIFQRAHNAPSITIRFDDETERPDASGQFDNGNALADLLFKHLPAVTLAALNAKLHEHLHTPNRLRERADSPRNKIRESGVLLCSNCQMCGDHYKVIEGVAK